MRRMPVVRGTAAVMAFLTLTTVSASTLMFTYSGAINKALNINTSKIVETDDASAVNTAYYDSEFGTDYTNKQAALKVEMEVAAENVTQAEEGTVLLRNENAALPLDSASRVTIFGNGAAHSAMGGSTTSSVASIPTMTFGAAMQKVFGADNINTTLLDNAYASLGTTSAAEVVEAPIADVQKYASSWASDYNDAAIAVFTRLGGESNDTAMYGEDGSHFLGLQANEKDLMKYLQEQKAAGTFKKIIVIINADQMMELDWLDDYDVDACVLAGVPGVTGYEGVANVLAGEVSPSGHLVDTYAANSLSAPATTYACENMQLWGNVDYVNSKATDLSNDGINVDYYTIYAEGIYVGYKYYETRYEDAVMGSGDASSSVGSSNGSGWNYAFGSYLAKVYAFPDLTDKDHSMSKPATAEYSYSGNQSAPELNYYWNTFDGNMSIQVANLGTYEFEAYPDKVDITFTNTENSADVVALTMENVTPDNNQLDTDALTKGATYDVTAVATSNSGYVLNPTSDTTTVATGLLLGDSSLITDAYSYSDGFANNIFAWPRAYDGFDLENGGTAGYAPAMGGGKTEFVATPVSSVDGSYTYDLAAGNWTRSGKLELKADGTFTAELEGSGPVNSSEYGGSWGDNGDGTATISYDPSQLVIK